MVNIGFITYQRKYYEDNLEKLSKEHPREYIFMLNCEKPKFFKTESDLEEETAKYRDLLGPTTFVQKIPTYKEYLKMKSEDPILKDLERIIKFDKPQKPRDDIKIGMSV